MVTGLIVAAVLVVAIVLFLALGKKSQNNELTAPGPSEPKREKAELPAPAPQAVLPKDEPKVEVEKPAPAPKKKGLSREAETIKKGLGATRSGLVAKLSGLLFGKKEIPASLVEELEETLLTSDVGVKTTAKLLERIRAGLASKELASTEAVWERLKTESLAILQKGQGPLNLDKKPAIVLLVGVNGAGKTTTIGKLSTKWTQQGKSVVLAAGDTFRAAAVAQLEVWGKRVGATVVKGKDGADPGAVAFEAVTRAVGDGADMLLIDTAGRLHTKTPLMDEIKKVKRSIGKALEGAPHETWLVLDATTGQNGLQQAIQFKDAIELTGIVLTKLDGTAKGGVVLAIGEELGVPVRYIGLGERAEDLREFHPDDFVDGLFAEESERSEA